jgi:ribonuclease HI
VIDDELAFCSCIKTLAKGKAAGPDGVANEILQALPSAGKQALHNMIRLMWATGRTPDSWKKSDTILLFKNKGTPLDLKYYRRIGLELTVYKLWTRMVTYAMADRAERHGMLSSAQAGFRSKRSTTHQLDMMTMVMEDAYLFKQNIYLMQADMTEAFDTISHDKLLVILYDLGFPTDAIEVVKDLYTNAKTAIKTPYGPTPELQLNRGTIQGDSLSPFLFLLYMEPLLRWLHTNAKGYMVGALADQGTAIQQQHQVSNITYADDLNVVTGGPKGLHNLKHQCQKVCTYTAWGNLIVNGIKTTVTGALHGTQPHKPYDVELLQTQLTNTICIQDTPVMHATYHPPRQAFAHLGVLFTMDLNFKPQLAATLKQVKEMVHHLRSSYASTSQKQRIIETCIRPKIIYGMTVAPYTLAEIKLLDSLMTRATKQAYGLSIGMPTAAAHQDKVKGGLGCRSLQVEHSLICIQRLVRVLNDNGPLGVIGRALFEHQKEGVDHLSVDKMPHLMNHCMMMRRLIACNACELTLRKHCAPQDTMPDMQPLAEALSQIIPETDSWDTQLVQDLHLLHSIGVTTVEDMLTASRDKVRPVHELAFTAGSRHVKPKHRKAWNRLTHYLATGQPCRIPQAATDLPDELRKLSRAMLASIRHVWPSNPQTKSRTILHLLSGIHTHCEHKAHEARDQLSAYRDELRASNRPQLWSNIRKDACQPSTTTHTYNTRHAKRTGYAKFLELLEAKRRHAADGSQDFEGAFYQQLLGIYTDYSHTPDVIERVHGLVQATRHELQRGKRCLADLQDQGQVEWAQGVQPGWLVQAAQHLRYRMDGEATAATEEDLTTHQGVRPCEFCSKRPADEPTRQCEVCARVYHSACLNDPAPATPQYACPECTRCKYTAENLPPGLRLFKVQWQQAVEPVDKIRQQGTPEAIAQLDSLLHHRQQPKPDAEPPLSKRKPLPPVSLPPEDMVYDIAFGQDICKKLTIHPAPINPHVDIEGTGKFEVIIRPVLCRGETEDGEEILTDTEMACVYHPDGRCTHMLQPEAAALLHQGYLHMQQHHPTVMNKLQAEPFAEEVHKLVVRYTEGTSIAKQKDRKITARNQRAIPAAMHQALQESITGCVKERFASPLNVRPDTEQYWSIHPRDQVFGAAYDAYNSRWTGASLAVPDFEQQEAERAVDWAIKSAAATEQPTLTVIVVPTYFKAGDETGYMRQVRRNQQHCRLLATVPCKLMGLQPPANEPLEPPLCLKWRMRIIAVGNRAGFEVHAPTGDPAWWDRLKANIRAAAPEEQPTDKTKRPARIEFGDRDCIERPWSSEAASTKWVTRASRRFCSKPVDCNKTPRVPKHWEKFGLSKSQCHQSLGFAVNALKQACWPAGEIPALKHDWTHFVYTDGSVLANGGGENAPGIGAAAHLPAGHSRRRQRTRRAVTVAVDCIERNDPMDRTCVNTINRAELSAICVALEELADRASSRSTDRGVHICTDSLGAIYQVAKVVARPQDLREHRHHLLLHRIRDAIEKSSVPIHLWKVKSHIGIVGNERADSTAKAVANGNTADFCEEELCTFLAPSHDRLERYWPHSEEEVEVVDNKTGTRSYQTVYTPMSSLHDALDSHVHPICNLGLSNTQSVYFSSWKNVSGTIDHKHSHAFLSSSRVTYRVRKLVLQYRYGLLPTHKLMKRYKLSSTSLCPLCGEEDGGHHAVSACPKLSTSVTNRHNDAGTEIVEAISKGDKGGRLLMSDVGVRKRLSEGEAPEQMLPVRKIPADLELPAGVPPALKTALTQSCSVPDMLLYHTDKAGRRVYTIVEIKYCRDTQPEGQTARAAEQHKALAQCIRQHDKLAQVQEVTLMLGVSGVIYNNFIANMRQLGVDGPLLEGLLYAWCVQT